MMVKFAACCWKKLHSKAGESDRSLAFACLSHYKRVHCTGGGGGGTELILGIHGIIYNLVYS